MDDFQLKNAGSGISASLTGYIIIARKRSREMAAKAENDKKAAESRAAVEDRKKRFSTLKFGGRGTEEWVRQVEEWVKANPPPAWLVEADDGLVPIDWRSEQVIEDEVKKARKFASDEHIRITHYPEESFCACEQCQPEFWKDWKDSTEEFFDPRI